MSKLHSVYLVGNEVSGYDTMFKKNGWKVYYDYDVDSSNAGPDLVLFTGGADINPAIYGEKPAGCGDWNSNRDDYEISVFNKYAGSVPIVGICRGAQLVNCLNGGSLWQHVDNHTRDHFLHTHKGEKIFVTSTHHQMMIPHKTEGIVLAWAQLSTIKLRENVAWGCLDPKASKDDPDTEVVYYSKHKHLCFQPHPEYGVKSCEDYFFSLVHKYLV